MAPVALVSGLPAATAEGVTGSPPTMAGGATGSPVTPAGSASRRGPSACVSAPATCAPATAPPGRAAKTPRRSVIAAPGPATPIPKPRPAVANSGWGFGPERHTGPASPVGSGEAGLGRPGGAAGAPPRGRLGDRRGDATERDLGPALPPSIDATATSSAVAATRLVNRGIRTSTGRAPGLRSRWRSSIPDSGVSTADTATHPSRTVTRVRSMERCSPRAVRFLAQSAHFRALSVVELGRSVRFARSGRADHEVLWGAWPAFSHTARPPPKNPQGPGGRYVSRTISPMSAPPCSTGSM